MFVYWVNSAETPGTRQRRIDKSIELIAENRRLNETIRKIAGSRKRRVLENFLEITVNGESPNGNITTLNNITWGSGCQTLSGRIRSRDVLCCPPDP